MVLLSALLFTILFYRQRLGVNLLFFEAGLITYWAITHQLLWQQRTTKLWLGSILVSALAFVVHDTTLAAAVNIALLVSFAAYLSYPQVRSAATAALMSLSAPFAAQWQFFTHILSSRIRGLSTRTWLRRAVLLILPIVIIILFLQIYSAANPRFEGLMVQLTNWLTIDLARWLSNLDIEMTGVFVLGFLISNVLLQQLAHPYLSEWDQKSDWGIVRKRRTFRFFRFRQLGLRDEFRVALFLMAFLNLAILILNILDIRYVWFTFEWEGQYLKQFVHEGTYLLIFSILISIIITLYFFRRNLNFYPSKTLKWLSYMWLAQNAILAISVGIRNLHYIDYFALAYKRIGVFIFLLLILYGLYSVYRKIHHQRSAFWILHVNSMAIIAILFIASLFPWDRYIANYNIAHADRSFLHLDFMVGMPDKTLPILDIKAKRLQEIAAFQSGKYPFRFPYMTSGEYYSRIAMRKQAFIQRWEAQHWLSWNLAEARAYHRLKHQE